MNISTVKDHRLVVGGESRIQLLPPEIAARAKTRSTRRALVGVVVIACLISAGGYTLSTIAATRSAADLALEQNTTTVLLRQQSQYAEVTQVETLVATATAARQVGTSTEIMWADYLQSIIAVLPAGTRSSDSRSSPPRRSRRSVSRRLHSRGNVPRRSPSTSPRRHCPMCSRSSPGCPVSPASSTRSPRRRQPERLGALRREHRPSHQFTGLRRSIRTRSRHNHEWRLPVNNNRIWVGGSLALAAIVLLTGWFVGVSPMLSMAAKTESDRSMVMAQNQMPSGSPCPTSRSATRNSGALKSTLADLRVPLPGDADMPAVLPAVDRLQNATGATVTSVTVSDGLPFTPCDSGSPRRAGSGRSGGRRDADNGGRCLRARRNRARIDSPVPICSHRTASFPSQWDSRPSGSLEQVSAFLKGAADREPVVPRHQVHPREGPSWGCLLRERQWVRIHSGEHARISR